MEFKRDSFTCQYCGAKAPDVLLHVDHIEPVAGGGSNDLLNLITACGACNLGKAAVPLDEHAVLERKRKQLAELQERREQIEMMAQWHAGMLEIDAAEVDAVVALWTELTGGRWGFSEFGLKATRKHVREFGLDEVMTSLRIAAEQYFKEVDGRVTSDSINHALDKVGGICHNRRRWKNVPEAERADRRVWAFINNYRQLSHYPENWQLARWWQAASDGGIGTPEDAADAIADEYSRGGYGSYWSAAQALLDELVD